MKTQRYFNSPSCLLILLFLASMLFNLTQITAQTVDTLESKYTELREVNFGYTGFIGHTFGIEFGKRKECFDCYKKHRKFFGAGLEIGIDKYKNFLVGPKLTFQRGTDHFGFAVSLIPYTILFKEFGLWVRPEFMFYPMKDNSISFGAGVNFHNNITTSQLYDAFGIVGGNVRYYFSRNIDVDLKNKLKIPK